MSQPQKFQFKLFIANPDALDLDAVVPVFHDFIRERALPELLIDVADYAHVEGGPGVVLIGHGYDVYVDLMDGRPGVLVSRKRDAEGSTEDIVRNTLSLALRAAALLEERLPIRFSTGEALFRAIDRLRTPNDDATHATLGPVVESVCGALAKVSGVSRAGDPRAPYTISLALESAPGVKEAAAKLAA
jgi:hypothetical protein